MSNRSPKILWLIDYSLMTSITHWCNWLLLNDPSITHGLLYYVRKTLLLLSCTTFFCLWFFCLCQMHFSLYLELLLTMLRRKVLITNIVQFAKQGRLSRCGSTTNGKEIGEHSEAYLPCATLAEKNKSENICLHLSCFNSVFLH